jgi:hypothetical protein
MKVQVGDRVDSLKLGDDVCYHSNQPHFVECVGTIATNVLAVLYIGLK